MRTHCLWSFAALLLFHLFRPCCGLKNETDNAITTTLPSTTTEAGKTTTVVTLKAVKAGKGIESCRLLSSKLSSYKDNSAIQISQMGNITWGNKQILSSNCFSEFVIFHQSESSSRKNLLCPNYKIIKREDSKYSCYANFTQDFCGKNIMLTMEAWSSSGELFEPSIKVEIDCSMPINSTVHLFPKKVDVADESVSESDNGVKFGAIILNPSAVSCRWSQWSSWTSCSVSCGNKHGMRSRSRSQTGSRLCMGTESQGKKCPVNRCAQNCVWGQWSDWGQCSVSCGTSGTSVRKRSKLVPHLYGGKPCIGDDTETKKCHGSDCPVDGVWSEWSRWGYCQAKCGLGNRTRTRSCDKPPPENGGKTCARTLSNTKELIRHPRIAEKIGDGPVQTEEEVESCKLKDCDPVNGIWSKWSRWSTCSVTCGRGRINRKRKCDSPSPAHGGLSCSGQDSNSRPCFLRRCVEDNGVHSNQLLTTPRNFFVTTSSPSYRGNLISSRLAHHVREEPSVTPQSQSLSNSVDITAALFQRVVGSCLDKPPFVHGFLGPFVKDGISLSRLQRYLRVGEIAYYACNHGKVIDTVTNQRGFFVACKESNSYLIQMRPRRLNDTHWPTCAPSKYCLEPAPKYLGYSPPVPRRNIAINHQIIYRCLKKPNVTYTISCFPDGRYKIPREVPEIPCEEAFAPDIPSGVSGNVLKFQTINTLRPSQNHYVIALDEGLDDPNEDNDSILSEKFGWIESLGFPDFSLSQDSPINFALLTEGYHIRVGVEDVDVKDYPKQRIYIKIDESTATNQAVLIGDTYVIKRRFSLLPTSDKYKFRLNFQIIAP